MDLKAISELFTVRDLRNGALGLIVVFGGIGLAAVTYYGHRAGYPQLTFAAAALSLIFVVLLLVFVVPPLARSAGREASQMDLPFEFTAGGAIMLGLLAIVGFSAWNTGNNLLFLILAFLAGSLVIGFLTGGACLKKLDVRLRFPETIFEDEETVFLVSVVNRKRIMPTYSVIAEVRARERDESAAAEELRRLLPAWIARRFAEAPLIRRTLEYFVYIPRRQTADINSVQVFQHRGRYLIKDFELSTKFPFGFFRHRRRLPAREAELFVFPKIEPVDHEIDDLQLDVGRLAAAKRGSGQDLLALREYQPKDDMRRVDWKATARARHLIVREFAAEDDQKVTIILDTLMPEAAENKLSIREKLQAEQQGRSIIASERFERGVRLTASLLAHFSELQAEIRLVVGSEPGDFGVGHQHLYECLKRLAMAQPLFGTAGLDDDGQIPGLDDDAEGSHHFLVSSRRSEEYPETVAENSHFVIF